MRKIITFYILMIYFISPSYSQVWEKTYPFVERFTGIVKVKDTTILLADYQIDLNPRFALVTIDSLGDTIRTRKYPISEMFKPKGMIATNDNALLLYGAYYKLTGDPYTVYFSIYKLNLSGDTIWTKIYPIQVEGNNSLNCIQTKDMGYLLLGTENYIHSQNGLLIKTDVNGNITWSRPFNTPSGFSCFLEESNGDILFVSHSYPKDSINLNKLDSEGNLQWTKEYAGSHYPSQLQIIKAGNNYLIFGADDKLIYKTDLDGNLIWTKHTNYFLNSAILTSDNNIVFAGGLSKPGDTTNTYSCSMIMMNMDGDSLWSKSTYGPASFPYYPHVIKAYKENDSCYFVVGELQGGYAAKLKFEHVDIDTTQSDTATININQPSTENVLSFPNPFIDEIHFVVTGSQEPISFFLYDSKGNVVRTITPDSTEFVVNREDLIAGLYYYHILTGNNIFDSGNLMIVDN